MANTERQRRRYPNMARRAENQAQREAGPALRQGQRDIARNQRQGQRASRSARKTYGRQAASEAALAQNLPKGIATPGLVRKQLMAGAAQTQKYGQGLSRLATRSANIAARDIREGLPDVGEMAAENLAAMVAERRAADKEREQATKAAKAELKFMVSRIPVGDLGGLHAQSNRDALAAALAKVEGITLTPAETRGLVERLYDKLRPTLPPGVLSDAERRQQSTATSFGNAPGLTDEQRERYQKIRRGY